MEEQKVLKEHQELIKHKIEVEDQEIKFNHDNTYKSCCLTIDKRALNYFTQAIFSGSIIAFFYCDAINEYGLGYVQSV